MNLQTSHLTISNCEKQKSNSLVHVLQVHNRYVVGDKGDDKFLDGIHLHQIPLVGAFKEIAASDQQIDAAIVGPEWSIADILSIRKVTDRNGVPLILHTLKFDWKAKEIAIETGVDEYHIGSLNQHFIRRIKLIRKVKSFRHASRSMQQTRRLATGVSFLKFFLKRLFDIVGSLLIIMLLLPVILLALPILILQTKGSLLNVSKRVGRNYKIFDLYEFNCPPSIGDKKFWLKLNLTGLPQIINVLKGDLSLVGCYPISVLEAEKFTKDEIARRFSVPAGIFGLWRLNNSEEDGVKPQDSSDADIEYAMKNSMWLDIKILFCHLLNLVPAKSKQEYERAKVLTIGVN